MAQLEVYRIQPNLNHVIGMKIPLLDQEYVHLARVRRAKPGDSIIVIEGNGTAWLATVDEISKKSAFIILKEKMEMWREPEYFISLALCVPKGDNFLEAIDLAVQLGASSIYPLISKNTVASVSESKLERANRRSLSAAKQTGRGRIPLVHPAKNLDSFLFDKIEGHKILCSDDGTLLPAMDSGDKITIVVGPEGGLTNNEESRLVDQGFIKVKLGNRRLRTETAVAAILSLVTIQR